MENARGAVNGTLQDRLRGVSTQIKINVGFDGRRQSGFTIWPVTWRLSAHGPAALSKPLARTGVAAGAALREQAHPLTAPWVAVHSAATPESRSPRSPQQGCALCIFVWQKEVQPARMCCVCQAATFP